MNNFAPFVRIGLRYLSGALLARGMIDGDIAGLIAEDPELEFAVAAAVAAIVEGLYLRARNTGGAT